MADPVTIAVVVAGGFALRGAEEGSRHVYEGGGLVFPLPVWRGYVPTVSDDFKLHKTADHRQHLGVDVMYRRKRMGVVTGDEPAIAMPYGTKLFFVPPNLHALAVGDGEIWSAERTSRGFSIVLDLGKPWAFFYQHLQGPGPGIPHGVKRGKTADGKAVTVKAGQRMGLVGGDLPPNYPLYHLHFEVWRGGGRDGAVDPQSGQVAAGGLNQWRVLDEDGQLVGDNLAGARSRPAVMGGQGHGS